MFANYASGVTPHTRAMRQARARTRLGLQPILAGGLKQQSRGGCLTPSGRQGHNKRHTNLQGAVFVQWCTPTVSKSALGSAGLDNKATLSNAGPSNSATLSNAGVSNSATLSRGELSSAAWSKRALGGTTSLSSRPGIAPPLQTKYKGWSKEALLVAGGREVGGRPIRRRVLRLQRTAGPLAA